MDLIKKTLKMMEVEEVGEVINEATNGVAFAKKGDNKYNESIVRGL